MKIRQKLALIAVASFAISFLLPAFDELPGYRCFLACWALFVGEQSESFGTVIYYASFVPTNAIFVIAVIYLFRTPRSPGWLKLVLVAATIHVLSWCAPNVYAVTIGGRFSLRSGYFLWLVAYLVCVMASIKRSSEAEPGATDNPDDAQRLREDH